jgi:tetratricopeptide (TPR) repeat protein
MKKIIILLFFLSSIPLCFAKEEKGLVTQAQSYRKEGLKAQEKGDLDTAMEYYQKAEYLDPYNPVIHNDLGIVYEKKGWLGRAEDAYLKAIKLDKRFLPAYYNVARIYEKRGMFKKAIRYLKMRIELAEKEDPWVWKAKQKISKFKLKELGTKSQREK